jgi:hypothetical protein
MIKMLHMWLVKSFGINEEKAYFRYKRIAKKRFNNNLDRLHYVVKKMRPYSLIRARSKSKPHVA